MEILRVTKIARRYFVMNAFDGALMVLGVIIGAYIAGVKTPRVVMGAGLGGSVAMGISGFCSAYMTEKAERTADLKTIEHAMLSRLDNSLLEKTSFYASIFVAFANGLSPILSSIVSILPFFLSELLMFPVEYAFIFAVLINLTSLFWLGVFIGRISQKNMLLYGFLTLGVGLITAILLLFLKLS